jgi:hypothetical protein
MRKILTALLAASLFFSAGLFDFAFAQIGQEIPRSCVITRNEVVSIYYTANQACPGVGQSASLEDAAAICCAFNAIFTVTIWIFWALLALAILFVLIGAFFILTAGGSEERITSGRNFLIFAAIGFILALAARGIPGVARAIVGL